jgi:vacuolar-type H+-ATPase subunit F/Vma7
MAFHHFLLVYDLVGQQLMRQLEFQDGDDAAAAYRELEREYQGRSDLEIVLVGADSIETIRRTHAHYFDQVASSSPYLAGV